MSERSGSTGLVVTLCMVGLAIFLVCLRALETQG